MTTTTTTYVATVPRIQHDEAMAIARVESQKFAAQLRSFGPDDWAYTSLFVDSAIAKWKIGTWEVVDKIPMSYSIGHLSAVSGHNLVSGPGRSPGHQRDRWEVLVGRHERDPGT